MKRSLTLLLVVLALSLAAFAQQTPVQTTVSDFGLVGSWGVDCQAAFDSSTFFYENGVVTERLGIDNGSVRNKIYTNAVRLDTTHLQVSVTYSDNTSLNGRSFTLIYLRYDNGRMQTVSNIGSNGTTYVQNGIIQSSGEPTPTWGRCQ